jgi:hypothetical protein
MCGVFYIDGVGCWNQGAGIKKRLALSRFIAYVLLSSDTKLGIFTFMKKPCVPLSGFSVPLSGLSGFMLQFTRGWAELIPQPHG